MTLKKRRPGTGDPGPLDEAWKERSSKPKPPKQQAARRPTYLLVLRAEKGVLDPVRALRALLKTALRRFGLRCISADEEGERR
jgi:hypothetical protein